VRNLVVAKNNILELYQLRVESDGEEISYAQLELVTDSTLYGSVRQLEVIRMGHSVTDWLLVVFNDAQLAFIAWDPFKFDFATITIRNYEDVKLLDGKLSIASSSKAAPMLRVDPDQRCAALLFYGNLLRIIPMEDFDSETGEDGEFVINLEDIGVRHVKDIVFLEGNLEPTIAILFEYANSWAGRVSTSRRTCSVRTLSLSLIRKEYTDIWTESELPYNCFKLTSVAPPVGGVLLLATNTFWYLNSSSRVAVAVNEFGLPDLTASNVNGELGCPNDLSDAALSLQACCVSFLTPTQALLNLYRGEMYCVELLTEVRAVVGFAINRDKASVLTSCTCKLSNKFVFLGSRLGDSMLVEFKKSKETDAAAGTQSAAATLNSQNIAPSVKEQLHMILMELRVGIDKASNQADAATALLQSTPQFESFLAEHAQDNKGLRDFCAQTLSSCQWNMPSNAWLEGTAIEEVKPGVEVKPDPADGASADEPAEPENTEAEAEAEAEAEPESESSPRPSATWDGRSEAIRALDEGVEELSAFKRRRVAKAALDDDDDIFTGPAEDEKENELDVLTKTSRSHIKRTKTFAYEMHDTLHNIGPIADFEIGTSDVESTTPDRQASSKQHREELVACSGYGKNGAIVVLNRDIRPEIVHAMPLDELGLKCRAIWSVQHAATQEKWQAAAAAEKEAEGVEGAEADEAEGDESEEGEPYQAFLLLSMEGSSEQTMILETGRDGINSMDTETANGFITEEETVAAGNVERGRFIVQICRNQAVLLDENLQAKNEQSTFRLEQPASGGIMEDERVFIHSAMIADPYVVLRTSDSRLIFLKVDVETSSFQPLEIDFGESDVTSVNVFRDVESRWYQSWARRSNLAPDDMKSEGESSATPSAIKSESKTATDALAAKAEPHEDETNDKAAALNALLEADDEDDDLFGGPSMPDAGSSAPTSMDAEDDNLFGEDAGGVKNEKIETDEMNDGSGDFGIADSCHFCIIGRAGGSMEIYRISDEGEPQLSLVFVCSRVTQNVLVLSDDREEDPVEGATVRGMFSPQAMRGGGSPTIAKGGSSPKDAPLLVRQASSRQAVEIIELHMHVLDYDSTRPVIAAVLSTGDVLLYRAFSYASSVGVAKPEDPQPFGFRVIQHDHVFAHTKAERDTQQRQADDATASAGLYTARVMPFVGVGGTEDSEERSDGLFVGGERPAWIFCRREAIRVHPMEAEGHINSFAALHNLNCPQGFVELSARNELRVCRLPQEVQYGGQWPYRKVALKDGLDYYTAHRIVYHRATRTYAVLASKSIAVDKPTDMEEVDENGVINATADDSGPKAARLPRYAEQYEIRILSPQNDWGMVDKFEFEPDEHGLAMAALTLKDPASGKTGSFIAVGTGWVQGESKTCKGRLLLLEVEQTLSGPRISLHLEKEEKGPVSAVCQLQGQYIVASAGTAIDPTHRGCTIIIHKWLYKDVSGEFVPRLEPAVFYMKGIGYISTLSTIKGTSIVIFGDAFKSVHLLMWREKGKRLDLLARDYWPLETCATSFALDGSKHLNVIVADAKQNLQIMTLPSDEAGLQGRCVSISVVTLPYPCGVP
jgi:hypothetical protein